MPQELPAIVDVIQSPVARKKCGFPNWLAIVLGGPWLLLSEMQRRCCTKGIIVIALVASRLHWLTVIVHACMQTLANF